MSYFKVTENKIILEELIPLTLDSAFGAQVIFSGIVREINHGKKVTAVAYDCFVPLAEKTFKEIATEVSLKLQLSAKIVISHRIGKLKVGEISIVIIVGSKHRDAAYEASRYIIEQIKTRAPIWKKEFYEDGETEWLQGHALCEHSHESNLNENV